MLARRRTENYAYRPPIEFPILGGESRRNLPRRLARCSSSRTSRRPTPNGVHVLRGISLQIDRGLFGLLGPNGAGKSTLMRTIATLQALDLLDHLALLMGLTDRTTRRAQVEALLARITPIGRRGMAAWRTLSRQLLAAYQESAVARPTPQFTTNQPLRPRAAVRPAAVSAGESRGAYTSPPDVQRNAHSRPTTVQQMRISTVPSTHLCVLAAPARGERSFRPPAGCVAMVCRRV